MTRSAVGWSCWERSPGHSLVLQDDAKVCRDLMPGLELALEPFDGKGVISAYCGSGRPEQHKVRQAVMVAEAEKSRWATTMSLNWGWLLFCRPIRLRRCWSGVRIRPGRKTTMITALVVTTVMLWGWRSFYTHPSLVARRWTSTPNRGPQVCWGECVGLDWSAPGGGVELGNTGLYPVRRPPTGFAPKNASNLTVIHSSVSAPLAMGLG